MTIVIIMCWLTALLVPVWMIVASKISGKWKDEWKSAVLPKLANVLGCSIEKLYESKEVAV